MNNAQAEMIVGMVAKAFPWIELDDGVLAVWRMAMADVPFGEAQAALHDHILNEERPPSPARIRLRALERGTGLPTADQAWAQVMRSMKENWTPGKDPTFRPDPLVIAAMNDAGGEYVLRQMTIEDGRVRFGRAYAQKREDALRAMKRSAMGDADDAHLINGFGGTQALTEGEEEE